jgi:hypothetical protein
VRKALSCAGWTIRSAACALLVMALASCGSSSQTLSTTQAAATSSPPTALTTTAISTSAATAPPSEEESSLHEAGILTLTSPGLTLTTRYRVAPLGYGTSAAPPSNVLEACHAETGSLEADAFAQGEVTLDYTKGRFPETVLLGNFQGQSTESLDNNAYVKGGELAWEENGAWVCKPESGESPRPFTMQPGQSVTYKVWLVFRGALSNEHPHITPEELNTIRWFAGTRLVNANNTRDSLSGPQVGTCGSTANNGEYLLPFAHFPFNATVAEQHVTCHQG